MMRVALLALVGWFVPAVFGMALDADGAIATLQLHVVDEQGQPLEGVEVYLGF